MHGLGFWGLSFWCKTSGIALSFHVHKRGIRALGISESFRKGTSKLSILAGVVMRADMIVDGFTFSKVKVGGMDVTQKIVEMYEALDRYDINICMHAEDWQRRTEVYKRNGPRTSLTLHTGHTVYARFLKISEEKTSRLLNKFTFHGAVPEPLRIARLLARSLMRSSSATS
jgi:endonuclease V-like protein UPF0215 family